jgi:hypothetical protein
VADADLLFQPIANKVRGLVAAAPAPLTDLKALYRGEPEIVPVKLYPFAIVYVSRETEAEGEYGYGTSTGVVSYIYSGYVAIEVLLKDTAGLLPGPDRLVDVPSYDLAHAMGSAALAAVMTWGGPMGDLADDPVRNVAGTEQTSEIRMGDVTMGLAARRDNYSNRASFDFRVFSQRLTTGQVWE